MNRIATAIDNLDWQSIRLQLDREGFAVISGFLTNPAILKCTQLLVETPGQVRVNLSGKQLGRGETIRWQGELPDFLGDLRSGFYGALAQVSNHWNEILGQPYRYPHELFEFQAECLAVGQQRELSELTRLRDGDYLSLQQEADGERVFPLQLVGMLSSPGEDFTGGEFILTEQRPRMQSRPMVVPLRRGDVAIITTAQRPFKGSKGYYRVNLKHAISRVRSGERLGFALSFHFAP